MGNNAAHKHENVKEWLTTNPDGWNDRTRDPTRRTEFCRSVRRPPSALRCRGRLVSLRRARRPILKELQGVLS